MAILIDFLTRFGIFINFKFDSVRWKV